MQRRAFIKLAGLGALSTLHALPQGSLAVQKSRSQNLIHSSGGSPHNNFSDTPASKINAQDSKILYNPQERASPQSAHSPHSIMLNNGTAMPLVGLGTYGLNGASAQGVIESALAQGYRLLDSAQLYGNESTIGAAVRNALRAGSLARERILITTKLWGEMSEPQARKSIESSLRALGLGYIDTLLLHRAYSASAAMWRAMEEYHARGLIRTLGVSNFSSAQCAWLNRHARVKIALNQCQVHLFYQREALRKELGAQGICLQAWSPLTGNARALSANRVLQNIAAQEGKTPAQVALRFLTQRGISVVPKSANLARLKENLEIFDFTLSADSMRELAREDRGRSLFGWDS